VVLCIIAAAIAAGIAILEFVAMGVCNIVDGKPFWDADVKRAMWGAVIAVAMLALTIGIEAIMGAMAEAADSAAAAKATAQVTKAGDAAEAGEAAVQPARGTLTGSLNGLEPHERLMVNDLLNQGRDVEIIPRAATKTADFYINGVKTELKTLFSTNANTAVTRITQAFAKPADAVLLDARMTTFTASDMQSIFARASGIYGGSMPGSVEVWLSGNQIVFGG